MKALIVSDIHGNEAALRAVLGQSHDMVVCLGDIVGYGPSPAACAELIREQATIVVRGNHDDALATGNDPHCSLAFAELARQTAAIGRRDLGASSLGWLRTLPLQAYWSHDQVRTLGVHATPRDPLYRYLGADPDGWTAELATVTADLVLVGHTHIPFSLRVGAARVVNPGSVGQPKDGDPRAAYAFVEDGEVSLCRIEYEVERTVAAMRAWQLPANAEDALAELLRTGVVPVRLMRPPADPSASATPAHPAAHRGDT